MARDEFHKQLSELLNKVLVMGSLVDRALDKGMQSLVERDGKLAQTVIEGDAVIDELNYEVQDEVLRLLALEAPLAKDLRVIVSVSSVMLSLIHISEPTRPY